MPSADDTDRRVDGLLASYGALTRDVGVLYERTDFAALDRAAIRQAHKEGLGEVRAALERLEKRMGEKIDAVDEDCKGFREEYRNDRKESRVSGRTVAVALITGSCAVLAALVAAAATILAGGGPG